jgi:hypothetical protein
MCGHVAIERGRCMYSLVSNRDERRDERRYVRYFDTYMMDSVNLFTTLLSELIGLLIGDVAMNSACKGLPGLPKRHESEQSRFEIAVDKCSSHLVAIVSFEIGCMLVYRYVAYC